MEPVRAETVPVFTKAPWRTSGPVVPSIRRVPEEVRVLPAATATSPGPFGQAPVCPSSTVPAEVVSAVKVSVAGWAPEQLSAALTVRWTPATIAPEAVAPAPGITV